MFPFEKDHFLSEKTEKELMKESFIIAYKLMDGYQPFGQASSTYEESGDPQFTALGIRAFLSSRDNIDMMCALGKDIIKTLVNVGICVEVHNDTQICSKERWENIKNAINESDYRTYNLIVGRIEEYRKKFPPETKPKKTSVIITTIINCIGCTNQYSEYENYEITSEKAREKGWRREPNSNDFEWHCPSCHEKQQEKLKRANDIYYKHHAPGPDKKGGDE